MKPLIGIVTKPLSDFECPDDIWRELYVKDNFRQIVFKNDCIAMGILSPFKTDKFNKDGDMTIDNLSDEEKSDLDSILGRCDGIILQGGMSGDFYELYIARYALEHNIPIIGVCAGFNTIARAAGCDIKSGQDLKIRNKEHSAYDVNFRHPVKVMENTLLHHLFNKDELNVSSLHTWYLTEEEAKKNSRIEINAVAENTNLDGQLCSTVECYTVKETKFAMGIKWHPEYMEEDHFQTVFSGFFKAIKFCEFISEK